MTASMTYWVTRMAGHSERGVSHSVDEQQPHRRPHQRRRIEGFLQLVAEQHQQGVRHREDGHQPDAATVRRHCGEQRVVGVECSDLLFRAQHGDSILAEIAMKTDAPALTLSPIGYMRTAHATKVEAARQPAAAQDAPGVIELLPGQNLEHAIEDLAAWERIWVIFWFDRNQGWRPKVLPPRSTSGRKGVLATRSPHRPNPLGLSVLRLDRIDGLHLHVRDVDLLDGTPILDIKPYVAYTDAHPDSGSGWLQRARSAPSHAVVFTARRRTAVGMDRRAFHTAAARAHRDHARARAAAASLPAHPARQGWRA